MARICEISVVPSRDRVGTTKGAVRSAARRTHPVSETPVVDDASPVPPDAERMQNLSPAARVTWLATKLGAAGARRAGIEAAPGDAVALLRSDDVGHPDKLARQVGHPTSAAAVTCGGEGLDASGSHLRTRCALLAARHPASSFMGQPRARFRLRAWWDAAL